MTNEGRPDSVDEIWLHEVANASLRRLTATWVPARDAGTNPVVHPDAQLPKITADGRRVVFASDADYLDEGVPNGFPKVWILDIEDGRLARIDTRQGPGSGPGIDQNAKRVVPFRTAFDDTRNMRVGAGRSPRGLRLPHRSVSRALKSLATSTRSGRSWKVVGPTCARPAWTTRQRSSACAPWTPAAWTPTRKASSSKRIIAMFIDGHSRVGGFDYPNGFLPFFIEFTDARFLAIRPDRSAFFDTGHPFITHIDGRLIEDWVSVAAGCSRRLRAVVTTSRARAGQSHPVRARSDADRANRYIMCETDAPRVVNAARYRLHPSFPSDHLGGRRFMFVESWTGWTQAEREAIARFKETFEPERMPPDDEFSDWHYLVT